MNEHGNEEPLDVVGDDVVAAVEERPCARDTLDRETAADRAADRDDIELASRADEVDDPVVQNLVDVHVLRSFP